MIRTLAAIVLRAAGCVLFVPLAVPCMAVALPTLLLAGGCWLSGGNEQAVGRILLNRALCWTNDLPLHLFRLARSVHRGY